MVVVVSSQVYGKRGLRLGKLEDSTVRTGIIEPDFWTLELPLLVRSTIFFLFFCLKSGAEGASFRSALQPLSKRGNFRRLIARFNYSSSYGII